MDLEEIKKNTIWKLPSCHYCQKPESALTSFSGRWCCGECLSKLFFAQREKERKELEEFIKGGKKDE